MRKTSNRDQVGNYLAATATSRLAIESGRQATSKVRSTLVNRLDGFLACQSRRRLASTPTLPRGLYYFQPEKLLFSA